jgi:uncharacterized protein (TIGR02145 family)
LVFTFLLFSACKKESNNSDQSSNEELLFQSFQMMNAASVRFIEIGDSMNITPPEALYYTSLWVQNQPGVAESFTMDSTYLFIHMANGYKSTISLREMTPDGLSVYRGSGSGSGKLTAAVSSTGGTCSNELQNKKVLLYSAFVDQFYNENEFQTDVVDMIENGDVDVEVTVLKNEQCTIDALLTCNQYGLVILDTHGGMSAIYTGVVFNLDAGDIPDNVDDYLTFIGQKIGSQHVQSIIDQKVNIAKAFEYDPQLQNQAQWDKYKQNLDVTYEVAVTSKGILEMMPDLSNTIVFANACFSGFTATSYMTTNPTPWEVKIPDPIKVAWMTRNPLTYYGYEASDGVSYKAPNAELCRPAEDTLIKSFFYDGDSTGNAHMQEGGGSPIMEYPWNHSIAMWNDHGPLKFNQYGNTTWCYGTCGEPITDARDGQKYSTVCIGKQVWMADNLRYDAPGSLIANDDPTKFLTYGRLYDYPTVSAGQGVSPGNQVSTVQGICPDGWHLPNNYEWELLMSSFGIPNSNDLAIQLKSPYDWVGDGFTSAPKRNASGFDALPTGGALKTISTGAIEYYAQYNFFEIWLSSSDSDCPYPNYAGIAKLLSSNTHVAVLCSPSNPYNGNQQAVTYSSCRCVKD